MVEDFQQDEVHKKKKTSGFLLDLCASSMKFAPISVRFTPGEGAREPPDFFYSSCMIADVDSCGEAVLC